MFRMNCYSHLVNVSYELFAGIYLTCTMAITTLSMVLTVFVLNLHHMTDKAVPNWLQRVVFIYLARMLGMCSTANDAIQLHHKQQQQKKAKFFQRASIVADAELDERAAIIEMNNCGGGGGGGEGGGIKDNTDVHQNNGNGQQNNQPVQYLEVLKSSKTKEEEKNDDYSKDWKRLAEIFDRLFFWLFLLAILISTLILFHPLTKSYMQQEGII